MCANRSGARRHLPERCGGALTDYQNLALRVTRCKLYRWVEGMVADTACTNFTIRLPDLSHPATVGCLSSVLREAYPTCVVTDYGPGCAVVMLDDLFLCESSLVEALIAALEAVESGVAGYPPTCSTTLESGVSEG